MSATNGNGAHPPDRAARRAEVRRTVERAVPNLEIDTTKVMSDEEIAEFQHQLASRAAAKKLVEEAGGRSALRARLHTAFRENEKATGRFLPSDEDDDDDEDSDERAAVKSGYGKVS